MGRGLWGNITLGLFTACDVCFTILDDNSNDPSIKHTATLNLSKAMYLARQEGVLSHNKQFFLNEFKRNYTLLSYYNPEKNSYKLAFNFFFFFFLYICVLGF